MEHVLLRRFIAKWLRFWAHYNQFMCLVTEADFVLCYWVKHFISHYSSLLSWNEYQLNFSSLFFSAVTFLLFSQAWRFIRLVPLFPNKKPIAVFKSSHFWEDWPINLIEPSSWLALYFINTERINSKADLGSILTQM